MLSLIVWTQVIVVTLKYVTYILRADNRGEGGMFALMALAMRKAPEGTHRGVPILAAGLFGAALFFGDAVITPAISVLSAAEGIKVAAPEFANFVVPIACVVLVALFVFQRKGTAKVGAFFSPITTLWFTVLGVLGVMSLVKTPEVLHALNPYWGIHFLYADGCAAFLVMGAVFLALTGAEALYADIGHFGKRPIRLAWICFVQPCLVLNYFGQGALMIREPEAAANPFYLMVPDILLYPVIALAVAATVIASQAVITGAFSLARQAVQLGFLPRLEVRHTSETEIGQIYVPRVNWILCACVLAFVIGFQDSSALAAAYGVSVSGEMCVATLIAYVVARHVWNWPRWIAGGITIALLTIDLTFFFANLAKIVDGGWVPLVIGTVPLRDFHDLEARAAHPERTPARRHRAARSVHRAHQGRQPAARVGHGRVPHRHDRRRALRAAAQHEAQQGAARARGAADHRDRADPGGRRQGPDRGRGAGQEFLARRAALRVHGRARTSRAPCAWRCPTALNSNLMDTSFFLGRENLVPKNKPLMPRWREKLFIALSRNAYAATHFFRIPSNRVVELGTQVEI